MMICITYHYYHYYIRTYTSSCIRLLYIYITRIIMILLLVYIILYDIGPPITYPREQKAHRYIILD